MLAATFKKRHIHYLLAGVGIIAVLNILYYTFDKPFWSVSRFIYMGSDGNVAAWYSSILLAISALAAGSCYHLACRRHIRRAWVFMAASLLLWFMSCDEISQFHETLGDLLVKHCGLEGKEYMAHSPWVWVLGPVVLAIFATMGVLLWKVMSSVPRASLLVVLGFVTIAAGGVFLETTINFLNHDGLQWLWRVEIVVEETLEMVGTLLITYGFIKWHGSE